MLTGSCLCGDIAFEIDGPVDTAGHCHCSMCRKFHGSARAAADFAGWPAPTTSPGTNCPEPGSNARLEGTRRA